MFDKILLVCLGIFLLLYGVAHATNLQIVWMDPITAIAALVAGVICLVRAIK